MRGVDPLDLRFEEVARLRPWDLLSPFSTCDLPRPAAPPPGALADLGPGPRAPYCALVADVGRAGPDAVLRLGLADGATRVLGVWDGASGTVAIEVQSAAGSLCAPAPAGVDALTGLAVVVNGTTVGLLVRTKKGNWRPVVTEDERLRAVVDLRDPAVLGRLRYVRGAEGDLEVIRLRAGIFGRVGVRDPQVVRTADGDPLVRDGKVFLTMTSAGLGFFSCAHWGVWSLDPADPSSLAQVGALFFTRGGLVLGDHAGQLVVDERTGSTTVLVSSWGDFSPDAGVHVRHLTATDDLLSGVHVLESHPLALPSPHATWDPSLARIGRRWHVAFVEGTSFGPPRFRFRPALARTESGDPAHGLERIGADEGVEQTEGTILQRFGRRWYLLASDRDAAEYPVYETTAMARVGALPAPYGTNIPHPMVLSLPGRAATPWWLVTFDGSPWHEDLLGYGTHGDLLLFAGRPEAGSGVGRPVRAGRRRLGTLRRGSSGGREDGGGSWPLLR